MHEDPFGALGKFDWTSGRPPSFTTPPEGYRGLKVFEMFGKITLAVKLRLEVLHDLSSALNPFAAFLLLQGLEVLSLCALRCRLGCGEHLCDTVDPTCRSLDLAAKPDQTAPRMSMRPHIVNLAGVCLLPPTRSAVQCFGTLGVLRWCKLLYSHGKDSR